MNIKILFLICALFSTVSIAQSAETQKATIFTCSMNGAVLGYECLEKVFSRIQSQPLPFAYKKDGCFARAHKISMILDQLSIDSRKEFIEGDLAADDVRWSFHVAPSVEVWTDEGSRRFIIDPSLFDHAVEPLIWYEKVTKSFDGIMRTYSTNRFTYLPLGALEPDEMDIFLSYFTGPQPYDRATEPEKYLKHEVNDMERTLRLHSKCLEHGVVANDGIKSFLINIWVTASSWLPG